LVEELVDRVTVCEGLDMGMATFHCWLYTRSYKARVVLRERRG